MQASFIISIRGFLGCLHQRPHHNTQRKPKKKKKKKKSYDDCLVPQNFVARCNNIYYYIIWKMEETRYIPELPAQFHQSDTRQQSRRAIKPPGFLRLTQAEPRQFHFRTSVQPQRVDLAFAQIEIDVDLAAEARFTVVSDFQDQFLVACRQHEGKRNFRIYNRHAHTHTHTLRALQETIGACQAGALRDIKVRMFRSEIEKKKRRFFELGSGRQPKCRSQRSRGGEASKELCARFDLPRQFIFRARRNSYWWRQVLSPFRPSSPKRSNHDPIDCTLPWALGLSHITVSPHILYCNHTGYAQPSSPMSRVSLARLLAGKLRLHVHPIDNAAP